MTKGINVLSLFDGISCGQVALEKVGIKVNNYFASEIDKHAIAITMKNYPNTIQLGDINNYSEWDLPKIDLIIGGSPCQDLSSSGSKKGLAGEKSRLFYLFVKCLEYFQPKYFLLENVASMSTKNKQIISDTLKVQPQMINSKLFLPQDRKRLYWFNWSISKIIENQKKLENYLEYNVQDDFFYLTPFQKEKAFVHTSFNYKPDVRSILARPLLCVGKGGAGVVNVVYDTKGLRYLTPIEFERLQGLGDNYTKMELTPTQRYKALGNGWTVDVIAHIFKGLKKELKRNKF